MSEFTVEFQPLGRRGKVRSGQSLLESARSLGVGIVSVCGGKGTCNKCRVQVVTGAVSEPVSRERSLFSPFQLEEGWRLACQAYPTGDCTVSVPVESMTTPQRTQLEGLEVPVRVKSPVRAGFVEIPPPSLHDTLGDADRLRLALRVQKRLRCDRIDFGLLRTLPDKLREYHWRCQGVVRGGELISLGAGQGRYLGLAVDFGTTKLAGYLIDMKDGRTLASRGIMNPQIAYGEDIIARCNMAITSEDGATQLQKLAADAISELAAAMAAEIGASPEDIVEASVVGNTAMHHLYLGLPVKQLALAPFVPAISAELDIKARDLGIRIAPGAYVHVLPNIAGFVGADHVAMLLATDVLKMQGPAIALDIGTNTEVSLIHNGAISSVSCASGPAFEGGHIKDGMRASNGAIERVRVTPKGVEYETIADAPPVGICGSGIIDTVAQIYLAGICDRGGRITPGHPRVQNRDGQWELVFASQEERNGMTPVVFTQHDVRELQLGKAAIRAGVRTLLEAGNLAEEDLREIIVAGAFGSYLDISSAIEIGMFPPLPLDRFRQVGNAAGMGAKRALISTDQRADAREIARRARYVELAGTQRFNQYFIQAVHLGRYRLVNGKREELS